MEIPKHFMRKMFEIIEFLEHSGNSEFHFVYKLPQASNIHSKTFGSSKTQNGSKEEFFHFICQPLVSNVNNSCSNSTKILEFFTARSRNYEIPC